MIFRVYHFKRFRSSLDRKILKIVTLTSKKELDSFFGICEFLQAICTKIYGLD